MDAKCGVTTMAVTLKRALILRGESTDEGTPGDFHADNFKCKTTELPWRDNAPQVSCVPAGEYLCVWAKSPKFGWCYHVTKVPGRGSILIHAGNLAGDAALGYHTHSHGCILPCLRRGKMDGQMAGLVSAGAVAGIARVFGKKPFLLEIKNA